VSINNSIVRQHKSGSWSVLGITASNPQKEDREGLVAVFQPTSRFQQFARRVWVPAHARRYTFLPFQVPPNLSTEVTRQTIAAISLDPNATSRETFQRRDGDPLVPDLLVGISHDPVRSGTYFRRESGSDEPAEAELDTDAWETLMAARKSSELSEQANSIPGDFLPPWSQALEGFDQFLLTSDRITSDAAGLTALRSWVHGGGRLWLMLDRLSPDTVRGVLGNAANFEIVDRVELDQYSLDSLDTSGQWTVHDACDYETPVEFVRVVTSARDVPCRVNGWPAAIWVPYGEGEILVTTLGPRGWRTGESRESTKALRMLAQRLLAGRLGRVEMKQFQSALQQRIGYQIPGRPFSAMVLASYVLALFVGGVFFYRREQAERLVWLVAGTTVVAAGILVATGAANSQSIPPTVTYTQFASVSPETDELFVRGLAATYDQQNRPVQWRGTERGWIIPEVTDGTEVRRQLWTDGDGSETQNASTRSGSVGLTHLEEVRPLAQHFAVRAWFGPSGLEGRITGQYQDLIDPVLVAPATPSLGLRLLPEGGFSATPGDVLASNQFSVDALLSDQQRRRQDLFRQLFQQTDPFVFPRIITLAAWRSPFESGLRMPEELHQDGESLVLVPVELERTPSGGAFRVPATFLRPTSALGGRGQSLAFNSKTGQWMQKLTAPSDTQLSFQLPAEVLPCELTKGTLSVRVNAPSRDLQVSTFRSGARKILQTVPDPNGVYDFDLSPEDLSMDDTGRVQVAISVSPTHEQQQAAKAPAPAVDPSRSTPFNSSTWQIEYVRLTVDGRARQEDGKP